MHALFDIDHVCSDAAHRDGMIAEGDWDAYHAASDKDAPVPELALIVNALARAGVPVVLITARPVKWRTLTVGWLARHGIYFDELLMRADDDYRSAPQVKIALAEERFGPELSDVAFLMDDREDTLAAFRAKGVTTMLVTVPR